MQRAPDGDALLNGVRLEQLLETDDGRIATPAYFYDLDAIAAEVRDIRSAFGAQRHLVAYAVKANSAGPIVRAVAGEGGGADVVSAAELKLVRMLGVAANGVVFSGVAKTDREIDLAIGDGASGILAIQAESIEEIPRIDARARALGRIARISFRVNPGIEADTHAYIATGHDEAKFGIPRAEIGSAVEAVAAAPNVQLVGVGNHIGSQLTVTDAYVGAVRMLIPVFAACETAMVQRGRPALEILDCGGGFGIDYGTAPVGSGRAERAADPGGTPRAQEEKSRVVRPAEFVRALISEVDRAGLSHTRVVVEPGRSIVGAHGVLCASVIMQKRARPNEAERRWLMIDAGMNDLIRPALYQALHRIEPLRKRDGESIATFRVVGPVCESSDDFGAHELPDPPPAHVVLRDAGAYGFTMASQYNGRALPTEVFLSGGKVVSTLRSADADAWVRSRVG
ncbi:MAG: diaminopimelate decarboxylase [Polyangiaceae bacterium]|nr:diaminopimelate decarboxylase [Polyangiaceae bacterium]